MDPLLAILHEDEGILVVNKPAGLVCHPTKGDERSSLAGRVRLHLQVGGPVHLINRLDRETSGVVVLAKSDHAARELRRQWESRTVEKTYWSIVHGHVQPEAGVIDAPLGKDERSAVVVKDCVRADGAKAQTAFRIRRRFEREGIPYTWLCVSPVTGRKHQIRIHLSHLGHPIVGDKLYGLDESWYLKLVQGELSPQDWRRLVLPWQALHAHQVVLIWRGQPWVFKAMPESWFEDFIGAPVDAESEDS